MELYRLAEDAVFDIDEIWAYLLERGSLETADRVVTQLFRAFEKLGENADLGHGKRNVSRILGQRLQK